MGIRTEETSLESTFKELPSLEGKTGQEVGTEYQNLIRDIERIRPMQTRFEGEESAVEALMRDGKSILDRLSRLSQLAVERAALLICDVRRLNRRLAGNMKITFNPEADHRLLSDTSCPANSTKSAQHV
ncbi:hypothetical protein [Alicyclobacillus mengziensis]|uniref:Uncharacterized protein n=1 Tax=Alicyclobacillus mengziensis TaxID=2931921 RepID=A0A9X7VXP6_9BACL|nr:hypothetical protein [Alicyclobacillus mengziensis]QSO46944.1 hypothetical protein JZ786_21360 [Alicyclobacillus mengziensis]